MREYLQARKVVEKRAATGAKGEKLVSIGKKVMACKFFGVLGKDRFGERGDKAFTDLDGGLTRAAPYYEITRVFGGHSVYLVSKSGVKEFGSGTSTGSELTLQLEAIYRQFRKSRDNDAWSRISRSS